ncbi:ABC transporter ATP-binding protein [Thiopseudomonas acetoxidans]|uniref:ATP-binding cassette domain-containing protein n=1 Tax=Thiopseudomonas acetoxidans TaxID=3041622 RepID=A0ABT7SNR7_9GAMM|nr:ATP-binding cassette domain-containing protein [Thiopseudomonas sp. CY1220]MDM7857830.1 ATP-binding cassette domain-containing protein [Thiopseudomonas sp. CY1220]NLC09845.1 ATP-binding cassette domain-containing protein [Gammaproteobacteria bacterium]
MTDVVLQAKDLSAGYGELVIQRDLNFSIRKGEVFVVMGGSGCGKSTLLRHLIGLQAPLAGQILFQGRDYWAQTEDKRAESQQHFGVLYQNAALWGAMTLEENICLPLETWRPNLSQAERSELATIKLSLVGLAGCEQLYPAELSGGMRKRAALARALALDPQVLFFDEPSAGLDPLSSMALDELILQLRDTLGASIVLVTHELPSIYRVADTCLFLDNQTRTQIALGTLDELLNDGPDVVQRFLKRTEQIEKRDSQ